MTKRIIAIVLIMLLVLPAVISAGGVLFTPLKAFAEMDSQREEALKASLSGELDNASPNPSVLNGENRYVIKFNDDASPDDIKNALKGTAYNLLAESEARLFAVSLENESFLEEYSQIIEYAEPDLVRSTLATVNDPETMPAYKTSEIYEAWDIARGSQDVIVAVLDTGVDRRHEDLADVNLLAGYDAVSGISGVNDDTAGHGTGVIGIIAATADNNLGIAGVAHGVTVLPVKVAVSDTVIYSSDLIRGIRFAADAGAKVINMSLGGYSSSYAEQAAVDYAISKGCILVAAAGNGGNGIYASQKSYPASYNGVISVASVDEDGQRSDFSQYNDFVDVAACGENVVLPYVDVNGNSAYRTDYGTSFSCAVVSGIVALAASHIGDGIRFENDEFLSLLADDCGSARDEELGHGIINARRILELADLPIITGVVNNGNYSEGVKVRFNRGVALLDGERFEDGQTVVTSGAHKLVVTDGGNVKTVSFRLNYNPVSYEFYEFPEYAFFEFEKGTAFLDGFPYKSGEHITASGLHRFVLKYKDEYLEKTVNLRYTLPSVYGVEDNRIYNNPLEICVVGDGTAELDGKKIYGKTTVFESGIHILELTSGNGMISKTLKFMVNYDGTRVFETDYANGKAAVDQENGFVCLYGQYLTGARIYDINNLEKYEYFLPIGKVYDHAFREGELLLFGESGVTVVDRTAVKSNGIPVKDVYFFEEIGYYTYLQEAIFGFGSGNMYLLDEFGAPALAAELGFDCEKAFYLDRKFYLLAPSLGNEVYVFDPVSSEMTSYNLDADLSGQPIAFGEGYLSVGNRLYDITNGELVLETEDNYGVMISDGRLFTSDSIVDIATGKILGKFPFQISHIALCENANYLFGTEKKAAVVASGSRNVFDFGAAIPVESAFSDVESMNRYHANGFYNKYASLSSAAVWDNKIFILLEGEHYLYGFDTESYTEYKAVPLKYVPDRVNCSDGYVSVCFKNANCIYIAPFDDAGNGRYISLPGACRDTAFENRMLYFTSGGKLYSYAPETDMLTETGIDADEVEIADRKIFVAFGNALYCYNFNFQLLGSVPAPAGKMNAISGFVSVGKRIYRTQSLAFAVNADAEVMAMKGNYAVTSKGILRLTDGEYVGDTAMKYSAASVITVNNTIVTFGGGSVSFCSYGDGSDILLTPEISGVSQGGVYVGSAAITYPYGAGFLDGEPFASGSTVSEIGEHEFIVVLPCARNISVEFTVAEPLNGLEFLSGDRTVSVGDGFWLRIKYLPEGADAVPVRFEYDAEGLEISEAGYAVAKKAGVYKVKAVAETDGRRIEAVCTVTVREDLLKPLPESGLTADRDENVLFGVTSGTSADELLSMFDTTRRLEILDKEGNPAEGYVATGYRFVAYADDGTVEEFTVSVIGDTDGDGYLTACDLYVLKRILGGGDYDAAYVRAGDVNRNGNVNDGDYRKLESILTGETQVQTATPEALSFGQFSVQVPSVIKSGDVIDVALVLSSCKYARSAFGKINYGEGLELLEFNSDGWVSDYRDFGGSLGFYAYEPNHESCNTAFKVMLRLRFRVTANPGETVTFMSEGINVSLNGECKTAKFAGESFAVTEKEHADFNVTVSNADKFVFDTHVKEYSFSIPYNSAMADISVTHRENQSVEVSSAVVPDSGETEIVLRISDSTGMTDYYTFKVTREEAPRLEVSCKLSSLEIEGYKLKPVFDPDFYNYSFTVPHDVTKINIYAVAESGNATVYVGDTSLKGDNTIIPVTVYAPDGESLTYKISVARLPAPEPESEPEASENAQSSESSDEISQNGNGGGKGFAVWIVIIAFFVLSCAGVVVYLNFKKKK